MFFCSSDGKNDTSYQFYPNREARKRYDPEHIETVKKNGIFSVLVWNWTGFNGSGFNKIISGRLKSEKYVKISDDIFMPDAIERFGENYHIPSFHDICTPTQRM